MKEGFEPKDYPLILDTCQSGSSAEAQERRHPELCLVDRVLPSSTYTLKDKASPLGSVRSPTPALGTAYFPFRIRVALPPGSNCAVDSQARRDCFLRTKATMVT